MNKNDDITTLKTSLFIPDKFWKSNSDVSLQCYKAHLDDVAAISYWSIKKVDQDDVLDGICVFRKSKSTDEDPTKQLTMLAKCTCIPKRLLRITRLDEHSEHSAPFTKLMNICRSLAKQAAKKREKSEDRQ